MHPIWPDSWSDPNSAWLAKADRAQEHINSLRILLDEFHAQQPYTLVPEATNIPGRLAYRLRHRIPIPVTIYTTIGDVLHNLRSALESLAYEVARRSHDGPLTPTQERDSTFPICTSADGFTKFVEKRRGLFDSRAISAFHGVQPFVKLDRLHQQGELLGKTREDGVRLDILHRLNIVWNIDKHRRLLLTAWSPRIIYWMSNDPTSRRAFPGDGTYEDGSILLYIEGEDEGVSNDVLHEFNLVLVDDPIVNRRVPELPPDDIAKVLQDWHSYTTRVFAQVLNAIA